MTQQSSGGQYDEVDPTAQLDDAEAEEIIEIRTEIEETRLEMGDTLSELGERLEPGRLVDQAKENVREATIGRVEETAKGVSTMVMETIKKNPIPAAIAGAGLALLWANRSSGSQTNGQEYYGDYYRGNGFRGDQNGGGTNPIGAVGNAASGVASNVASGVGQGVGQVGQVVGQVPQMAGGVIDTGRQTVEEVGWRLERFMQASPLAVGAIALGAGALVGALVPETPQERQVLGDASQQLASTVRDTVGQVTQKAEETLDQAETSLSGASA